ncbi:unnamed protein product [Somion occarium]|uniref:Uncharacterized protein n=2 Tax=Somion occarium TaxID=3059160 RepID=A0ABP1D2V8_9APHY
MSSDDHLLKDEELDQDYPLPRNSTRGTERIVFPRGMTNSELWRDCIIPKVHEMTRFGKRLTSRPLVLSDGVIIEWVLDRSVKEEDNDQLIQCQYFDEAKLARENLKQTVPAMRTVSHLAGTGVAEDPICLDSDEDLYTTRTSSVNARRSSSPEDPNDIVMGGTSRTVFPTAVICTPCARNMQSNGSSKSSREALDATETSEDTEGYETDDENAEGLRSAPGSPRIRTTFPDSDPYGGQLLVAGSIAREALSRLEQEGRLPTQNYLGISQPRAIGLHLKSSNGKSKVASPSTSVPNAKIKSMGHPRTASGKRRPSPPSSASSSEMETARKRSRLSSSFNNTPRSYSQGSRIAPESDNISSHSLPPRRSSTHKANRALHASNPSPIQSSSESSTDLSSSDSTNPSSSWDHAGVDQLREQLESEGGRIIRLPRPKHARARRLLVSTNPKLPMVAVYMRGDAQFIHRRRLYREPEHSLPCEEERLVTDACLLNDSIAVLGYEAGPSNPKISLIPLVKGKADRPQACRVQQGNGMRFLSGGYDHTVRLWTLKSTGDGYIERSREVAATHAEKVQTLAFRSHDSTVLFGGGSRIYTTCLQAASLPKSDKLSNALIQIHVNPSSESHVFLEMDHLDNQVALYDTRRGAFNRKPCLDFGYREVNSDKRYGRSFTKGSVEDRHFARGYRDGTVCVWDLRKTSKAVLLISRKHEKPAVHTVLSDRVVMVYGDTAVTCWDIRNGASRQR